MILAKKIRLYPTEEQEQKLWQSVGTARFIYNWTLNRQEENYKNGDKFIKDSDLRKEITRLKKDKLSWLNEVSNNVAKQAVKDCCNAYKNFFKGLVDKPKFKSRKKSKPSFYNDTSKLKAKEKSVLIEKIGWVKTKEQVPMDVKYTNPRIIYDNKYWYLSVGIEQEQPTIQLTDESLGIDVGVKDLAVCSNGMTFKNINQITTKIVKTKPSRVVMEDLNIKGMMKNKHLSKTVAEQCLYDFKMKMKYKCEFYGIEFVEADRYYPSSKLCSCCGSIKKDLKLKDRIYKCSCGLNINRDYNASINLSRYKLA